MLRVQITPVPGAPPLFVRSDTAYLQPDVSVREAVGAIRQCYPDLPANEVEIAVLEAVVRKCVPHPNETTAPIFANARGSGVPPGSFWAAVLEDMPAAVARPPDYARPPVVKHRRRRILGMAGLLVGGALLWGLAVQTDPPASLLPPAAPAVPTPHPPSRSNAPPEQHQEAAVGSTRDTDVAGDAGTPVPRPVATRDATAASSGPAPTPAPASSSPLLVVTVPAPSVSVTLVEPPPQDTPSPVPPSPTPTVIDAELPVPTPTVTITLTVS